MGLPQFNFGAENPVGMSMHMTICRPEILDSPVETPQPFDSFQQVVKFAISRSLPHFPQFTPNRSFDLEEQNVEADRF